MGLGGFRVQKASRLLGSGELHVQNSAGQPLGFKMFRLT